MNKVVILVVVAVVVLGIGFFAGTAYGKNRAKKDCKSLLEGNDEPEEN